MTATETEPAPTATTAQVYTMMIKASPEAVWQGITDPRFVKQYFFGTKLELELVPGGSYKSWSPDGTQPWVDTEVIEVDPPRKFVHGWRPLYDNELADEPESRVTWEIEDVGNGVSKLTVTHDLLEAAPKTAASVSGGWIGILSGLKTLLETGEPLGWAPR